MSGKTITIDFGNVFPCGVADGDRLVREIEKSVQVNTDTIIEEGVYKHRVEQSARPMRLKVTVELQEA